MTEEDNAMIVASSSEKSSGSILKTSRIRLPYPNWRIPRKKSATSGLTLQCVCGLRYWKLYSSSREKAYERRKSSV